MNRKKVFVSGCFDLLHSGHVEFFRRASKYGDVYVSVGSDKTLEELKHCLPINPERERLYMVKAVRYVTDAFIGSGSGMMDFLPEIRKIRPDIFVVNEDGDRHEKRELCMEMKMRYVVLKRVPGRGLPTRSTTGLRKLLGVK